MSEQIKKVSKQLSYVLRHCPESVGLQLSDEGWSAVSELLAAFNQAGKRLSLPLLQQVVAENDKQRFEFSADGQRIRARQGHSVAVDLGYEAAIPPPFLYHGTATRFVDSILATGLAKQNRHHVHLSVNRETMLQVGSRHGKPVVLTIDAARMQTAGHAFFVTGNQVWLTDHVPAEFISISSDPA